MLAKSASSIARAVDIEGPTEILLKCQLEV